MAEPSRTDRPHLDALLERIRQQRPDGNRGRLKVFLGAASGVGKTFTMLEAAQLARQAGGDVVVGIAETHGRPEIAELLVGLEVLPRRQHTHRDRAFEEFDLDRALQRRPTLLLVDDMAHTNVLGSRHAKRWQDIEDVLAAGINVYTTLNVQHVESLNDVVRQITGVPVPDTVPDAVLDRAAEVEVVDVSAEVLLERLRGGKVHVPEQAARAVERFFRRGNLIALRELALRQVAEQVEHQMRSYRLAHGIEQMWPAAERLLVCIGPNPLSQRLIRTGSRMADALHAEWYVLHVASPRQRLSASDREALTQNLRLAERLGARTMSRTAEDVEDEILAFARRENIARIVVGKPTHAPWRDKLFGSLLDRLIRQSRDIEVYVISGDPVKPSPRAMRPRRPWVGLGLRTAGTVVLATAVGFVLRPLVSSTDIAMVFLLAVTISAVRYGTRPAVIASVLSIALFDLLFVLPYYTFAVADVSYVLTFAVMLTVALLISRLAARVQAQTVAAREREEHTAALYALSRDLAAGQDAAELAAALGRHIRRLFGADATVLLPDDGGQLHSQNGEADPALRSDGEQGMAAWVQEHGQPAGAGTDTLSAVPALYLPLRASGQTIGVLRIVGSDPARFRDPIRRQLLETLADQSAVALERVLLARRTETARVEAEGEKLRSALLSSLSHDLRTPLGGIEGAASALLSGTADQNGQRELAQTILGESRRMMRLIGNLLDMVRVEAGVLQPRAEWQSIEEIVGVALVRLDDALEGRQVTTHVPPELPLVAVDGLLIEQVIVNLVDNAVKYSPPGSPIEVTARADAQEVTVCIEDRGPGLPDGQEALAFAKFYRLSTGAGTHGAGLGLTICRAIITAHGGRIWAEARASGGARFCFSLPRHASPPSVPEEPEGD